MKHTPTPWRADSGPELSAHIGPYVYGPDNVPVAYVDYQHVGDGALSNENAAFIVRACNAHDDLVAAVEELLEHLADNDPELSGSPLCGMARAALAKAKSE